MQAKLDFPQIKSSVHDQVVILTQLEPKTSGRFFLCAQDVIDGVTGDKSTLQTYEEFCNQLQQPNTIPRIDEEQQKIAIDLMKQKKLNLMKFQKQIEEEKQVVKRLVNDKLQELYKNKCNELVVKLQNELDGQYKMLQENYDKLGVELEVDREKEAGVDKYEEIKKKVKEINNSAEIEEYLQSAYKTKIDWQGACQSLQSFGQRSEHFYKDLIQKQLSNAPEIADAECMVETWMSGLNRLVGQVNADGGKFKNMLCMCGLVVPLEVGVKDISLVKNGMLKQDTQLIIKLKEELKEEQIQAITAQLEKLTNLVHFGFDAGEIELSANYIKLLVQSFQKLQKLQSVQIKAFGAKICDQGMLELAQLFPLIPNIKELQLELGYNGITNKGLNALASQFHTLTKLQCFSLNLECNAIKSQGIQEFCEQFEKIIPQIVYLNLNFSGFVLEQTKIQSPVASNLIKCLKKAEAMKYLCLDFGYNQIDNQFIGELVQILSSLPLLFDLNLNLNNNKLDTKAAKKLGKFLNSSKICELVLNLCGNEIKAEGANQLISALTEMELLFKLKLNLRNTGIKKGLATQMKIDLENKKGRKFEEIEFLV